MDPGDRRSCQRNGVQAAAFFGFEPGSCLTAMIDSIVNLDELRQAPNLPAPHLAGFFTANGSVNSSDMAW